MTDGAGTGGLAIEGLVKRFGATTALDGVSLSVRRGEIVGLFGRDGAGKTTCFESIMGLTRIDAGRVFLEDRDITRLTIDRRAPLGLCYLPQETSIFRGMTTAQNIGTVLEIWESDPQARRGRLDSLLGEFALDYVRDTPATRLSGGERRRCEVARAMAMSPAIMLLDEPFAGIDPLSVNSIKATIGKLRDMRVGVLMSDQNVHETIKVIDRAYVLHDGRMIFEGTPEAMLADADVHRFYLGDNFL